MLDYRRAEGQGEAELARAHAPADLDLGAQTPEVIVLSVLSEIVMHRRGASGTVMREKSSQEAAGHVIAEAAA